MTAMDAALVEAILRRSNPAIEAERAAVAANRWVEFQAERVPPPSRLHPRQRAAWNEAMARAAALGYRAEMREALVFPVWWCSNDDDIPGAKWVPATAVSFDDGALELHEYKRVPEIVLATVEHARLAFLVRASDFAPDVALAFRNDHFGVLESRRTERVTAIVRTFPGTDLPLPEHDLPPFATEAVRAKREDPSTDRAITARIDATLAKLRVFPDGAEALVATKPRL